MQKNILKFGLIAGVITAVFMVLTMLLLPPQADSNWGALVGYASMIIAFSTIFFGIRSYRDRTANGQLTFLQGLTLGIGITSIATVFYVTVWMIYYPLGGQEIMDNYFNTSLEKIKNSELGEAEKLKKLGDMTTFKQEYQNPLVRILYSIFEIFPVGLVIALISALILRRK